MNDIVVFTDGSSRGNPGPGGWAAIVTVPKKEGIEVSELGGREAETTNNRMEMNAAIEALSFIARLPEQRLKKIILYTDSSYLLNGSTRWIFGWQKNGWVTSSKKEVENRDLWEKIVPLVTSLSVEWKQVLGHAGMAGNERVDEIATAFADGKDEVLFHGPIEKYPVSVFDLKLSGPVCKKSARTGKAYSYLSLVGGEVVRHQTWAQCEARVKGKSGARFKKAFDKEDEEKIIASWRGV